MMVTIIGKEGDTPSAIGRRANRDKPLIWRPRGNKLPGIVGYWVKVDGAYDRAYVVAQTTVAPAIYSVKSLQADHYQKLLRCISPASEDKEDTWTMGIGTVKCNDIARIRGYLSKVVEEYDISEVYNGLYDLSITYTGKYSTFWSIVRLVLTIAQGEGSRAVPVMELMHELNVAGFIASNGDGGSFGRAGTRGEFWMRVRAIEPVDNLSYNI